ncbi:uncharacterized protein LOC131901093 isoform X2 [Peromyscus eremicus]|uniref:uncharacterized protein LOC131901093 isoform X2 n=1 Tax=Peromyscus eremicus TaxID=42410 RepID=UPI0027DD560E|nr:uncharacterized protein LOC131901093 isoform X2 [Peromyscus eremicus]
MGLRPLTLHPSQVHRAACPFALCPSWSSLLPGPWMACLLRRVYRCPRPPVVHASNDVGQFHLNAHHYQGQGFGRKPFSSPISRLHRGTLEEGTQAPVPGSLTSAHCCLPFPCVHPGTDFCQKIFIQRSRSLSIKSSHFKYSASRFLSSNSCLDFLPQWTVTCKPNKPFPRIVLVCALSQQ